MRTRLESVVSLRRRKASHDYDRAARSVRVSLYGYVGGVPSYNHQAMKAKKSGGALRDNADKRFDSPVKFRMICSGRRLEKPDVSPTLISCLETRQKTF
jgi:hypothetical protein